MMLWWKLTTVSGCPHMDWTWRAIISMIWRWYDHMLYILIFLISFVVGTHLLVLHWRLSTSLMEVNSYEKKSVMCDCHCIPHDRIRVDSLCFWSSGNIWSNCRGSAFFIIHWMAMEFMWRVHTSFLWDWKLGINSQNVPCFWSVFHIVAEFFSFRYAECWAFPNL